MFFGEIDTVQASGCILAHSIKTFDGRISKGTQLTAEHIQQLLRNDITNVVVARLENGDIHENDAAHQLATAVSGEGVTLTKARTGRVNLHAKVSGLCNINRDTIVSLNSASHAITLATLAPNQWVQAECLIATVKIIPYSVPMTTLRTAISISESTSSGISVTAPTQSQAYLVQTRLEGTAETMLNKTSQVTRRRLIARAATLVDEHRCSHSSVELTECLRNIVQTHHLQNEHHLESDNDCDTDAWIIIAGASAISDINDVIPSAVVAAGGEVQRLGIPVDPGNLLLLGRIGNLTVVGLPGCARSPKYNGFDQVLDRMACNLPVNNEWLNGLSVGGLMNEILERPSPRVPASS